MTDVPPTSAGSNIDSQRPILARALETRGPSRVASHQHPRGQLVYTISGVVRVRTTEGSWIVAPSQAVWVPPEVDHEVIAANSISIRTLFIDASATAGLPKNCCVLNVPPLMRELILKAVDVGDGYSSTDSGFRLMQVILDLLQELQPAAMYLPMGQDKRLQQVIEKLYDNPADDRSLDQWARICGASARTLARLFVKETGMNFGDWRKQLRLLEAIDRLGQEQSVTRVALDLGYKSPSAFIAMFRRSLGSPPGAYFRSAKKKQGAQ